MGQVKKHVQKKPWSSEKIVHMHRKNEEWCRENVEWRENSLRTQKNFKH